MGAGDWIMSTAQAKAVADATGMKTDFGEWHHVFKNNPYIGKPGHGIPVMNRTGCRPYILNQTDQKCIFNPNFRAVPGEIYFSDKEIEQAKEIVGDEPFILVQPEVKLLFSKGNKAWPRKYWAELVKGLEGHRMLQMVQNACDMNTELKGAKGIVVETFRLACAVVSLAKMLIATDGGLHHAAAAVDTPAVVIWTGFSHPRNLGYAKHMNVRWDDSPPCGMKVECDHCKRMAEKLEPEMVLKATREYLETLDARN